MTDLVLSINLISGTALLELPVEASTPVLEVLNACQEPAGTPSFHLELVHGGCVLKPERTLEEEGIVEHVSLILVRTPPATEESIHDAIDAIHVRYLLECCADVNDRNPTTGLSAVFHAAMRGNASVCLELLSRPEFAAENEMRHCETLLHAAASVGLVDVCKAILNRKEFTLVNAQDERGRTALHIAAFEGFALICASIVAHPEFTALHIMDMDHQTAYECAADMEEIDVCVCIAEHCNLALLEDVNLTGMTLLHWAVLEVNHLGMSMALSILARHSDLPGINVQDSMGRTVLHCALEARAPQEFWVILLCRSDFKLFNAPDASGKTILHYAVMKESAVRCGQILWDNSFTDVDRQDDAGKTALQLAIEQVDHGNLDLLPVCTDLISRVDARGVNEMFDATCDRTLLHWALEHGFDSMAMEILARMDYHWLNKKDESGQTVLHLAAAKEALGVCQAILGRRDFKAVDARDDMGRTALQIAQVLRPIADKGTIAKHIEKCIEAYKSRI